jgi:hypothetical protein
MFNYGIIEYVVLKETGKILSRVAILFYVPTSYEYMIYFLYITSTLCNFFILHFLIGL